MRQTAGPAAEVRHLPAGLLTDLSHEGNHAMAAPRSLRHSRRRFPADWGHRADLLRSVGVCAHCEQQMYEQELRDEFNALPVAERIASRWGDARARYARVAATAEREIFGPPF